MNNIAYEVKRKNVSPEYISGIREVFEHPTYYEPKSYPNVSRYSSLRRLKDTESGKYYHENWIQKFIKVSADDQYYTVTLYEKNRLDIVSNMYYSTPKYWWVIAIANNILDPFDLPIGTNLRIPPIISIYTEGGIVNV